MSTKVREVMNRGNNLLIVGLLLFTALGVFTEVFREDEWLDKADDIFVVLAALVGVIWYLARKNRYQFSWFPFGLLAATFAVKVLAFVNEFDDPTASGDEFGVLIPLGVMVLVNAVLLYRARKAAALPLDESLPEIASGRVTGI